MKAHLTAKSLEAKRAAYENNNRVLTEGMFLTKTSALTDAEMAAAREAVAATSVVQAIWSGNVDAAVDAMNTGHIDLEAGYGNFSTEIKPGIGTYGGDHTGISFTVQDSVVDAESIRAYTLYNTKDLVAAVLGTKSTPDGVSRLLEDIETKYPDGCSLQKSIALLDEGDYGVQIDTSYLDSGYVGPYATSNFSGNDGFEYINLDSGCLIRIGRGYANLDTETWSYYASNELDTLITTITPSPVGETADIVRGSESNASSRDLDIAAEELTLLVQYAQLLEDPEDLPAEVIMDKVYDADKKYREEQGQTNFFNDQVK